MTASTTDATPIALIDLAAQRRRLGTTVDEAIMRVVDHGRYIMGPEVGELEQRLTAFTGAKNALTCASGTDALVLALRAIEVGTGDAVIVPTFTFAATAEAVALVGATPVFCDVDETSFNVAPRSVERAIGAALEAGLRPRSIIPVDLFGQPADYPAIAAIAGEVGATVIADAAQSFGGSLDGQRVGTLAPLTTTSFFPAKPLGCYGDGGAVLTDDDALADRVRSLRVHGKGSHKYENVRIGLNSRLDTIQAAVLLCKMDIFDDELVRRQQVADRYAEALGDVVGVPTLSQAATSAWAQYTVVPGGHREALALALKECGIPTAVYYPLPLHQQRAYASFPSDPEGLPTAERLSRQVLSLPMHPYLTVQDQSRVSSNVVEFGRPE